MNGHSSMYEDGYKAAIAGDSKDTNPYVLKRSTQKWEAGYKAGMVERDRVEAGEYRKIAALLDPFNVCSVPIVEMVKRLMVDDATVKAKAAAWDAEQGEIERLRRFLQTIVNIGDKEHHAAFDGERWREMRHCANQALNTKNDLYEP